MPATNRGDFSSANNLSELPLTCPWCNADLTKTGLGMNYSIVLDRATLPDRVGVVLNATTITDRFESFSDEHFSTLQCNYCLHTFHFDQTTSISRIQHPEVPHADQ